MMLSLTNGHMSKPQTWHTQTVSNFFNHLPWTGEAVSQPQYSGASEGATATALDMRLQVREFFNRFPWDGQPTVAAPIMPVEIQPSFPTVEEITLDGFADLF